MASPTKITKTRRQLRRAKMGQRRKLRLKNHGSTPSLLNLDDAPIQ